MIPVNLQLPDHALGGARIVRVASWLATIKIIIGVAIIILALSIHGLPWVTRLALFGVGSACIASIASLPIIFPRIREWGTRIRRDVFPHCIPTPYMPRYSGNPHQRPRYLPGARTPIPNQVQSTGPNPALLTHMPRNQVTPHQGPRYQPGARTPIPNQVQDTGPNPGLPDRGTRHPVGVRP